MKCNSSSLFYLRSLLDATSICVRLFDQGSQIHHLPPRQLFSKIGPAWIHKTVAWSCNDGALNMDMSDVGDDVGGVERGFVFGEDNFAWAVWDAGLVVSDT